MLLGTTRVLLSGVLAACVASPSTAQQTPLPPPPPSSCGSFKENVDGDWVPKQDLTLPGPTGPIQVKAGTPVDVDLQDELDHRCK